MKKLKDFKKSDESSVVDLRKMQGPPPPDVAEALANKKAWDDYEAQRSAQKKTQRENFEKLSTKKAKNAADYAARMKGQDQRDAERQAEEDQAADDAIKAYKKGFKGSKQYDDALKDISSTYRKKLNKLPKLKGGGVVRGNGKARGGKPCKVC